jgi:hypothetical protein
LQFKIGTLLTFVTVGGFLATINQYWIAYHVTILFAALLVLECFFLPETLFPRALVLASEERHQNRDKEVVDNKTFEAKRMKELGYVVRALTQIDVSWLTPFKELPKSP